jgi:hypothetical protein
LLELLLLELDLLALLFEPELDALFFDPLELPDLVGMTTLLFRRAKPLAGANGSGPGPSRLFLRLFPWTFSKPFDCQCSSLVLHEQIGYEGCQWRGSAAGDGRLGRLH